MSSSANGPIGKSEVSEWYRGKTVFITGGTGFMGKVLVEKLLRSTPVEKIYLLMRPKKGVEIKQRIHDTLSFRLFDRLREQRPEFLKKVFAIKGDITMDNLGISDSDREVLKKETNIIFHAAATINFTEPMKVAVCMNMLGTKRVITLAKEMEHLEALVHVSTAYANCDLAEAYEELYTAPMDPEKVIKITEWCSEKVLAKVTNDLVSPRPNTYTFTKALAEHILVNEAGDKVPFSIIRPSIVCGAWREPAPGWVDNMFAFSGLLVGMGKGVLRSLYIKEGIKLDFVPVDIPINLMIVAAYNTAMKKFKCSKEVNIFCCSTGHQNPLTIEGLNKYLKETVRSIPQENPVFFPDGSAKTSKLLHTIHIYVANILPAYVYDMFRMLLGKKPFAVKLCSKMIKAINALEYFMLRDWTFHNENVQGLWGAISQNDRRMFHFDVGVMDWRQYIDRYQRGVKKFILKEGTSPEDLERAHSTMNKHWYFYHFMQLLMIFLVYSILSSGPSVYLFELLYSGLSEFFSLSPTGVSATEEGIAGTSSVVIEEIGNVLGTSS